ncbi:MAG: ABC transporter substrate-binding protein [Anaerolineae bacterium]|nr:ABC transporter substrate-binding protein [Anaerolineae bacterium]
MDPRMRITVITLLLLALISSGMLACTQAFPEEESLVFMAGYKPQANLPFVGVYVAQELGYFEDEGLTVEVQHSAGGGEHLQLLIAGKVQVTTQDAGVLLQRRADPGLPLVAIGLVGQRGQQAFAALSDAGIESVEAWSGRQIGYKGTPPPDLLALLDAAGLVESDVELISVGFDPRVLAEGMIDVYPVFTSNEPYTLKSWGYDVTLWEAADYGVPTLGLAYVTTEKLIDEEPDRLARFTRAALRGISYAETHLDEAIDIVMIYTGPDADRDHMRYMLETEAAMAHNALTEAHGLGWQTAEQWKSLLNSLQTYGAITEPVDVDAVFTTQFLDTD